MGIVSMREMLAQAERGGYAVGFHNVVDSVSLIGILRAAEDLHAPIMVGIAQVQCKDVDFKTIMNILVHECSRVSVPVAVHLDHGLDSPTVREAIELGCTSVMFDGSRYPLEENIERTKAVVEYAHERGVSVEGEFGEMGNETTLAAGHGANVHFTDITGAKRFVTETGVDALAVSFGSVHGIHDNRPSLNLHLLEQIDAAVSVPLVMHGGSGHDRQTYRQVIARGIRKINYVSYGYRDVAEKLREYLDTHPQALYDEISYAATRAFTEVFKEVIISFKSDGKAW